MVCDQRRDGGDIQHTEGESSTPPPKKKKKKKSFFYKINYTKITSQVAPLLGNPDLPVRRSQRKLGPFTVMILKKSISFQSYIFTAYQVKDGKELARSLLVFNLLKIIHPFQNKNYLRT